LAGLAKQSLFKRAKLTFWRLLQRQKTPLRNDIAKEGREELFWTDISIRSATKLHDFFDLGAFRLSWRKERPAGFIEKLDCFPKPAGWLKLK